MEWIASPPCDTQSIGAHGALGYHRIPRLDLYHGGCLENARISYELTGPPHGPVVVVMGGISASRHVCTTPANDEQGWWESIVGSGKAVDTNHFRVLGIDYLGGNGASTGPKGEEAFPTVSTNDQADCLAYLLDYLGIEQVDAVLGASYGGMVALAFAARHGARLARLVVVSAGAETAPMSTAWRTLQRRIIKLGFLGGVTREAVCLSRALAMTTYRSPEEFQQRFNGPPKENEDGFIFPVEEYLCARGEAFADSFHPGAFLCLSESIDLHRVDLGLVRVPTTLISVHSDRLVPPQLMYRMAHELGERAQLVEIDSLFGHDAFLKEIEQLTPIIAGGLRLPGVPDSE